MDSRWVLRFYSGVVIAVGLAMTGTSIRGIEGVPLLNQSLLWIAGTVLEAAGCAALGLSFTDNPAARRLGLLCFAIGHLLLGAKLQEQWRFSLRPLGVPWEVTVAPLAAGGILLLTALASWIRELRFADTATSWHIRSAYDEHIRHIARREERARLARDLHDAVKQQLFVIQTAAATVQERFDTDAAGAREALTHVRTAAREATTEMEALLEELQAAPMENNGLVESLKKQCEALALRTGAGVSFQPGTLPAPGSLPRGAHEAIYRVAQEALANVARHARATQVIVSLQTTAAAVELRVTDNGSGLTGGFTGGGFESGAFDERTRSGGMGIANMHTRAAALGGRVSIVAGSPGTDVVLCVPVTNAAMRVQRLGTVSTRWAWAAYGFFVFSNFVFIRIMGDRPSRYDLLLFVAPALAALWYLSKSAFVTYRRRSTRT